MPTEAEVVQELTEESFEGEAKQPGWCLVDFYASWCPHCRAFRPNYEQTAADCELPVKFFAADVEKCREAARQFGVMSIPTLVLLRDGEKVDTHVGGMGVPELQAWLQEKTGS